MKEKIEAGVEVDLCLIGSKAMSFFKRMGGNVVAHVSHLGDSPSVSDFVGVVKVMLDAYLERRIDALYVCSNEFVSTMRQEPTIQQVLPLVAAANESMQHHWDYIYEPDNAQVLMNTLLTRYIESQIYRAVIENIASEQAARMLSMRSATDNAADMISNLQLVYNKARQAAITRELSEIVAGASVI
jgi:F-type H+-transporting ATPase subunit gamma